MIVELNCRVPVLEDSSWTEMTSWMLLVDIPATPGSVGSTPCCVVCDGVDLMCALNGPKALAAHSYFVGIIVCSIPATGFLHRR